jgi:multidrug resistance efflux pump
VRLVAGVDLEEAAALFNESHARPGWEFREILDPNLDPESRVREPVVQIDGTAERARLLAEVRAEVSSEIAVLRERCDGLIAERERMDSAFRGEIALLRDQIAAKDHALVQTAFSAGLVAGREKERESGSEALEAAQRNAQRDLDRIILIALVGGVLLGVFFFLHRATSAPL